MSAPSVASPRVLAILGPTAVGKSAVAHAVATALDADVVVADPFQRYRGLEIASDAPSPRERQQVRYHFVGDLAPTESSSAGDFATAAHSVIDTCIREQRPVIVSGGTGLYVRAALADLRFPPDIPDDVRTEAERLVETDLVQACDTLTRLAPARAAEIDLANPRRVARALGLAMIGETEPQRSELWTQTTRHPTTMVVLRRGRDTLDERIADRVDRELADGLVSEIAAALDTGVGLSREAAQMIGVREVRAQRRGELSDDGLRAALVARTRRLARAQETWLRKVPATTAVDLDGRTTDEVVAEIVGLLAT